LNYLENKSEGHRGEETKRNSVQRRGGKGVGKSFLRGRGEMSGEERGVSLKRLGRGRAVALEKGRDASVTLGPVFS